MTRAAVYVAGPSGFDAGGRRWHAHVCAALEREGYEVLDPWRASAALFDDALSRHGDARTDALRRANHTAGETNARLIGDAVAVLALLDGVDVDSGTAAEIGYAAGTDTPVVAYRTDWRTAGDNEAALVNLQVEYFVQASGGELVAPDPSLDDDALLARALAALRRIADAR